MARPLLPDGQAGSIQLRPQATPVDTFVRPVAPGGSALGQLASALSSFAPELRQFGAGVSQREAATADAQGEAWATQMQSSKEAWAGLVKDGKVAPSQNPHFILAAKRKFGQVAASQFQVSLQQNLAQLGDGATPDQFEQAVSNARSSFLKDHAGAASNDLAFMQGFNGPAEQQVDAARRAFANQHAKQFEEDATTAFASQLHKDAQAALDAKGDVSAVINKAADEWATVNPDHPGSGTMTSRSMSAVKASVLFSLMKSTGNPELVKRLAKQVKDGNGVLADNPVFFNNVDEVADHVVNDQRNKEADEHLKEQKAQKDATESVTDALLTSFRSGQPVDVAAATASLSAAGVRDAAATATQIAHKLPELDPRFYVGYRSRVASGQFPSIGELTAAQTTGKLSAPQYDSLLSDIAQAQNAERALRAQNGATTEAIWSSPEMKLMEDGIRAAAKAKATVNEFGFVTGYSGFTETDVEAAVAAAKIDLAQTLANNWTKYGSRAATATLAASTWRTYAYQHHIITGEESSDGQPVLPSAKDKANAIKKAGAAAAVSDSAATAKAAARNNTFVTYTRGDLIQMRADLQKLPTMTPEQRRAWATDPRRRAIMQELGATNPTDLATKLAEAYNTAKP